MRHHEAEDREQQPGVGRLAGDEQVMAPHQEADHRDGQRREGDERVAEDVLAREGLHHLADHAHRRQDHDVDGRVRVEPEQVLEQHRVAAQRRVEDAEVQRAFRRHHQDRDGNDRGPEDHDQAGGVVRPDEQRQPEPGHPRGAHAMDGDDEVQAGQDRREAGDEDAQRGGHHVAVRGRGAVRGIERPAGVDAAGERRGQGEDPAQHVDVPAEQVDARERQVLRADHDRDEEVAEHGRDRRDQEEEHHHDAMHREHLVVGLRRQQIAGRRQQLEPDQHGEEAAQHEEHGDRDQVQERDALVILRQQPRRGAMTVVEVIQRFHMVPAVHYFCPPVDGAVAGPVAPPAPGWLSDRM